MSSAAKPGSPALLLLGQLAGVGAPIVYGATVAIGAMDAPGYSHLSNMISDLTGSDAPNRAVLSSAFCLYNVLLAVFALTLPASLPSQHRGTTYVASTVLLIVAIAGVGMVTVFPADPLAAKVTTVGWIHIGLASVASFGTMLAVALCGWTFWSLTGWRWFSRFSFAMLAGIAVSGAWTAAAAALELSLVGVAERTTIGAFMVWVLVFAWQLLHAPSSTNKLSH